MEILISNYKVRQDWLHDKPPKSASPIWKEIKKAKTIIVEVACFLIRDRADVNVWEDPWVPGYNDLFLPQDLRPYHSSPSRLTNLLTQIYVARSPISSTNFLAPLPPKSLSLFQFPLDQQRTNSFGCSICRVTSLLN